MKTERISLIVLKPFPNNPRRHSDLQVDEMAKSIEQFGQYRPVVVDETDTILAGHGIVLALMKLGRTEADALRLPGLTANQKKKLVLADNKLAELGTPDYDAMFTMLSDMKDDLEIPGFDPESLGMLISNLDGAFEAVGTDAKIDEAGAGIDSAAGDGKKAEVECPYCKRSFVPKGKRS